MLIFTTSTSTTTPLLNLLAATMTGLLAEVSSSTRTKKREYSSSGSVKKISSESWQWQRDLTSKLFGIFSTLAWKPSIKVSKLWETTSFSTQQGATYPPAQRTLVPECELPSTST